MREKLIAVDVLAADREGLVTTLLKPLASKKINIVDIHQSTTHNLFSMFMLLDSSTSKLNEKQVCQLMRDSVKKQGVEVIVTPLSTFSSLELPRKKELLTITIFGKDSSGIVSKITNVLSKQKINIERMNMVAREKIFAMEMLVGRVEPVKLKPLRRELRLVGEKVGVDIIVQSEDFFRRHKRLVVFDMDSTLIDAEVIDEVAQAVGVGDDVKAITEQGMRGEMDFEEGLRRRVRLLKGTPVAVLERIYDNLKFTPGSEELIYTLKEMGFKIALISGGFTYFTDRIKKRLGLDYAYANHLELKDGELTGNVIGGIIDRKVKGEIVKQLIKQEGLTPSQCVAVGDGANDKIMLENAGLGIAFNAKDILKESADGSITKQNMRGLLYCLGIRRLPDDPFS